MEIEIGVPLWKTRFDVLYREIVSKINTIQQIVEPIHQYVISSP